MAVKGFDCFKNPDNLVVDVYMVSGHIYRECDTGPKTEERTIAFWLDDKMLIAPLEQIKYVVFYEKETIEETTEQ